MSPEETCGMNPNCLAVSAMELRGELAFPEEKYTMMKNRRRKIMEASTITNAGGEVRRVHIIYFLSRMGRVEHPHLIRVHHLNRNGVFLRDVKRWLADLRGKEMPETFAWSYKRRYKNSYVWQDLLDDDLITPISDNEYVLKGSEIFLPAPPFDGNAEGEKKASISTVKHDQHIEVEDKQQRQPSPNEANTTAKSSTEISPESPVFSSEMSTLTEDSMKQEGQSPRKEQTDEMENRSSSFYSNLLSKKKKKRNNDNGANSSNNNGIGKMGTPSSFSSSSDSSQSSFAKSKSYSNGTSKMLRNLITCGAADTNDAALVALNKAPSHKHANKPHNKAEIGEGLETSTWAFGTSWNQQLLQEQQGARRKSFDGVKHQQQEKHQSGFGRSKVVSAANMPVSAPICS